MPEVKLPDATFSWNTVVYVIAFLVALSGVLVALLKGWEAYRKISVRDRVTKLERRMDKVESRLSLGDKRFELQSDDLGHLLSTQLAVMVHLMSGNDHDKLSSQIESLSKYMTQRTTKAEQYAAEHEAIGGNNE